MNMLSSFAQNLKPHIEAELRAAQEARLAGDIRAEFQHLENTHVIGQESTYWHVKTHSQMLLCAIRNQNGRELFGQTYRLLGALTKTAIGLVPRGNTGGANVSPFKTMAIKPDHAAIIRSAKVDA